MYENKQQQQTAVLAAVDTGEYDVQRSVDELEELAKSAGAEVLGRMIQRKDRPDPATLMGAGRLEELADFVRSSEAELVIFDHELAPAQQKNIEKVVDVPVIDRTTLILDIFAQRAKTAEGRLQVELAQYQYLLPKLSGMGTSMSRLGGGIGTRGPGETKLETDRRHIRERITRLQAELDEVRRVRATQRERRVKNSMPVVALVGYTNAGKSTLLNALTGAGIPANDRLFDTLDTTTRRLKVSDHLEILLSDTVGFIAKLPHHLIEAFQATLEELQYADLLLHVIDAAPLDDTVDPFEQAHALVAELEKYDPELAAKPRWVVLNKMDLVPEEERDALVEKFRSAFAREGEPVFAVSAATREGLTTLLNALAQKVDEDRRAERAFLDDERFDEERENAEPYDPAAH